MGSSFLSKDFAVLQRAHMNGGLHLQGLPEKFAMTLLCCFGLRFFVGHSAQVQGASSEHASVTVPALVFNS